MEAINEEKAAASSGEAAGIGGNGSGAGAGAGAGAGVAVGSSEGKGDDNHHSQAEDEALVKKTHEDKLRRRIYKAKKSLRIDFGDPSPGANNVFRFGLSALPRAVVRDFAGRKLRELWLTNNAFTHIPEEFGRFTGLQTLCMSGNQLSEIPDTLCNMKSLQKLYLARNAIVAIPVAFGNLTNLKELRLDHNQLAKFPMPVTKCRKLLRLSLCFNTIPNIPSQIRRLTNLSEIDLDNNRIGPSVPPEFLRLASLVTIGLANNCLEEVPAFAKRPAGAVPLSMVRLTGNRSSKYKVLHATGEVIEGQNIPVRADGYLELRKGVVVVGSHGAKRHEVQELEGYLREGHRYAFTAANWHRRSQEFQILKARAARKPWKEENRLK